MKTVCEKNKCAGCMACVDICPKQAIEVKDELSFYNAEINDKCIDCGLCHKVCPQNNTPEFIKPKVWYQGWAKDEDVRETSSSGGFATAISLSFVEDGGIVYTCGFDNGMFVFSKATNAEEVKKLKGSKYVKSNPQGVYEHIKKELLAGRNILFIGLPCQVAALINSIDSVDSGKLYTVDLICHGTPSPKLLDYFLKKYNRSLRSMKSISFRKNNKMQIWSDDEGIVTKGASDKYTIAFLKGLTYTENCYKCLFARIERVSDLTLGDSWGSELNEEKDKGISLALCQTDKGKELLQKANVELKNVNLDIAIMNNQQLSQSFIMPKSRANYFKNIKKGKSFNWGVFKCFPKECIKQDVKRVLIKIKLAK